MTDSDGLVSPRAGSCRLRPRAATVTPDPGWVLRAPAPETPVAPGPRPSFTVLVPAYQAAAHLPASVGSALAQDEPAVQVLVVDDGSTDDVVAALRPFGARVELVRSPHVGLPAVRNLGLQHARGDFVAFLDADDVLEPGFLAGLATLSAARPDLDILTTDARFVVDGVPAGTFYEANGFPVEDQRAAVLERCFLTTKTAVRTRRLHEVGGFDPALLHGEDWECWIRLVLTGSRAGLVDAPLSQYHLHGGQLSARRGPSLRGRYDVMAGLLARPDLTGPERAAVAARLPALRLRAAVATAREASGTAARAAWWQVARTPGASPRLRLGAVARAVLPARPAATRRPRDA